MTPISDGRQKRDTGKMLLPVPTIDGIWFVTPRSAQSARVIRLYWRALGRFLRTGNRMPLRQFARFTVATRCGRVRLITNLAILRKLAEAGELWPATACEVPSRNHSTEGGYRD